MKHISKTQNLMPVFLIASMAFNLTIPQLNGNSSVLEQSYSNIALEDLFYETTNTSQIEQNFQIPLVGGTGFIAGKMPLSPTAQADLRMEPAKKIIVVSRVKRMVTAYSSTPDQTDDTPFITASNTYVRDGIVAANFARFRTKIRFPTLYGDKIFVVEDRMNKRYPHRVDIWMQTRQEAKQFGIKTVQVEIVREIASKEI